MNDWWLIAKADLPWPRIVSFVIMFLIIPAYNALKALKRQREEKSKSSAPPPRRPATRDGNAKRSPTPGRPAAPQKVDPLLAEIQKFLNPSNADKRSPARPRPSAAKPVRVEPIVSRGGPAVEDTVGRPLDSRHLDTTEFGTRASRMTDDLKRGDAQREQHFQQTFTHKLGRLTDTSVAGDKAIAPDAPAVSTVAAAPVPLSDWRPLPDIKTEDLRRAIMLNEILQRPEHRW